MSLFTTDITFYRSGNITVKAISTETPSQWDEDTEWLSPWAHQSSVFFHGFNAENTAEMIEFKRQFALAALDLAAQCNLGFEVPLFPDLLWAEKAGCGGCLCSPGIVTQDRIMHTGLDGERGYVDLHITLESGTLN